MNNVFLFGFLAGIMIGTTLGVYVPRQHVKNEVQFKVGDCLSNGLYYERVTGVRYGSLSKDAIYELQPTINGKLSAPDTTLAWIMHDSSTVVSKSNCK